jgi:hypothetical protein
MVILPFSPIACAMVTTLTITVIFYVGRLCGMKKVMNDIEKEIEKNG